MDDRTKHALLTYLQTECARVYREARDECEFFKYSLRFDSTGYGCWNCEQKTIGLQMAAADWLALIESVRDDCIDDIKPADRDAMWSGFRLTAAGERLAADAELAWFRAREPFVQRARDLDKWERENPRPSQAPIFSTQNV